VETRFATLEEEGGVSQLAADLDGVTVVELTVPALHVQPLVEPDLPYLAVFLDGALEKGFERRTMPLRRGSALTVPAGATHDARFASAGARIVIVKARTSTSAAARQLRTVTPLAGPRFGWLAHQLAAELRAMDPAAPLAAEGLALELLAAAARSSQARRARRPSWLAAAEEVVGTGVASSLRDVAAAVGVGPTHLARTFRVHHGVSVGEYARRARLDRAARELRRGELSLAEIAAEAGFADQSHFTRLFKRYFGTTPGRYRESTGVPPA